MNRKQRINFSVEQKLEYAKLMVNEGYSNRQIREISGAGATAVSRWKRQYLVETNYSYGKRGMHASLLNKGFSLGVYRTASLMRKANVFAITPRKKHYYPNTGKSHIKADNILRRQFYPEIINPHWVGDISYIRTHQGL